MSEHVSDERLQAIRDRESGKTRITDFAHESDTDILFRAITERDATIAELRTDVATLRERIGGLIGEREDLIERERDRDAAIAELRKPVDESEVIELAQMLSDVSYYNLSLTAAQSDGLKRAASLLQSMETQLHLLRKPVAVQPNPGVESIRAEVAKQYDHVANRVNLLFVLSAYDTLAQDNVKYASAHAINMAEIESLKGQLREANTDHSSACSVIDEYTQRIAELQEREALKFPRETKMALGWTIAYEIIESIHNAIEGNDFAPSYEGIELVLLEVERRAALAQPTEPTNG